jgi:hypothetical protein
MGQLTEVAEGSGSGHHLSEVGLGVVKNANGWRSLPFNQAPSLLQIAAVGLFLLLKCDVPKDPIRSVESQGALQDQCRLRRAVAPKPR